MEIKESSSDLDLNSKIKSAINLETFGELVLQLGLRMNGQETLRNTEVCRHRFSWVNGKTYTLDEIGKLYGVTRERIRQITSKVKKIDISLKPTPILLTKILVILRQSNSKEEFIDQLYDSKLISHKEWTISNIKEMAEIVNFTELVEEINNFESNKIKVFSDPQITKLIQRQRSKIGLIDVYTLSNMLDIDLEFTKTLVKNKYARSLFYENIALARGTLTTTFESVLVQQLSVKSPLKLDDLYDGIKKECDSRRYPLVANREEMFGLIKMLCGEPASFEVVSESTGGVIHMSTIEKWFISVFQNSPLHVMHLNDLISRAVQDNLKIGSVSMFLSSSPIIRKLGNGMYHLVGDEPLEQDIKIYEQSIKSSASECEIEYKFEHGKLSLRITPNMSALAGGSVLISTELANIVKNHKFVIECSCRSLSTKALIKVPSGTFWTGFAAVFSHLQSDHSWRIGNEINVDFDFENNLALVKS